MSEAVRKQINYTAVCANEFPRRKALLPAGISNAIPISTLAMMVPRVDLFTAIFRKPIL